MNRAYRPLKAPPYLWVLLVASLFAACSASSSGSKVPPAAPDTTADEKGAVLKDVPQTVSPKARYLFYLHGRIIEERGLRPTSEQYGVYEYEQILDALKQAGFVVISEARAKNTDVKTYAQKVVGQVRALLKAGVPAGHITVVGASKGAAIDMWVSTYLKNRDVNFVLLADCNDEVFARHDIDLWGNVLSIYDVKDEFGHTCQRFFDKATGLNRHKEIEVKLGIGHALLYRPMKEWVEPTIEWARQSASK
jgi:hypothetical protein